MRILFVVCLYVVYFFAVFEETSAQNDGKYRAPLTTSKPIADGRYRPAGDGRYRAGNDGKYRGAGDGKYRPGNDGKYIHKDVKYIHNKDIIVGGGQYVGDGEQYKGSRDQFSGQGNGGSGGGEGNNGNSQDDGSGGNTDNFEAPLKPYSPPSTRLPPPPPTTAPPTRPPPPTKPAIHAQGTGEGGQGWRIIHLDNSADRDGYHYLFETENKIIAEESGRIEDVGAEEKALRSKGFYEYVGDDGVLYRVDYIADTNGFIPQGAHLPQIPAATQKLLQYLATKPPAKD